MRMAKVVYEYVSIEEEKENTRKLRLEGLEFVSCIHKQNTIGKFVYECTYVNTRF